ncbi:MAG: polysaccharide deacetylase family protein [Acidimicrobiales bacterium]
MFDWPGGKRLAVYLALNVESFAFGTGTGPTLTPAGDPPNSEHRKFAWRDYGQRVGIWRMVDAFTERKLPVSYLLNAYCCQEYPEIVDSIKQRGEEVVGHGRSNSEMQGGMLEVQEKQLIDDATATLTETFGVQPRGWMSPGATQSSVTLDLLKEAGYEYSLDWPLDDQPIWLDTRSGPILSVPYPLAINDYPNVLSRAHTSEEYARMALDQFDEMLEESARYPLVYGLSLHTFISGQPHQLRALKPVLDRIAGCRSDIWLTSPGHIATHVARQEPHDKD